MNRSASICAIFIILLCTLQLSACTKGSEQAKPPSAAPTTDIHSEDAAGSATGGNLLAETRILSTIENFADTKSENQSLNHAPQGNIVFSELGRGVAYIASDGSKQRVVHNGTPGAWHEKISYLTISPDGKRLSYRCSLVNKEQFVSDGIARQVYDNVRDMVYSPDSRHLAYVTQVNNVVSVVLDDQVLETGPAFGYKFFTPDSSKFVYTIRPGGEGMARLSIKDLKSGSLTSKEVVDIQIAVNRDAGRVAVAIKEGDKQRVIDFDVSAPEKVHIAPGLYDTVYYISLSDDGRSVAFLAARGNSRYLVLNGKEERLSEAFALNGPPVIRPDLKGAGVILSTMERYNRRHVLHQSFFADGSRGPFYAGLKDLVYSRNNSTAAVVAKEGEEWFVLVNGRKGPSFDAIVTPAFSPDGKWLVYRARKDARRFVVVADAAGKEHRPHAEFEMVFPTEFTPDGSSVAYGVKDGNKLIWKVEKLQ
jgi:WD40 repeat protein